MKKVTIGKARGTSKKVGLIQSLFTEVHYKGTVMENMHPPVLDRIKKN